MRAITQALIEASYSVCGPVYVHMYVQYWYPWMHPASVALPDVIGYQHRAVQASITQVQDYKARSNQAGLTVSAQPVPAKLLATIGARSIDTI